VLLTIQRTVICGRGVDSDSCRNESQVYIHIFFFLGGGGDKDGRCVEMATLPFSCAGKPWFLRTTLLRVRKRDSLQRKMTPAGCTDGGF
jgi:hypothetical protein